MNLGHKLKSVIKLSVSYLLLIIIAICCIYPALWVVLSSFKDGDSLFSETLIPEKMTTAHYERLFTDDNLNYPLWYWNTFKVATLSTILGTILVIITAYALSRFRFRGRQNILTTMLILGMFPGFMSMIAIYVLMIAAKIHDSHWGLILVYAAGAPLGAFVAKGFFDTIPKALEEAALIDGASHTRVFVQIVLPLSRPMITYIGLTTFTGIFFDYIFASFVLRSSDNKMLAVGLYEMISSRASTEFTTFAAGAVLAAIPITLLFMFLQKFLVAGLTSGATKG